MGGKSIGRLFYKYIKYAIDNKYVDKILCYSSSECDYYSELFQMPREKFAFVHLGISEIKNVQTSVGNYIFSTGRSNRDYPFLIEAEIDIPIKIACEGYVYNGSKKFNNIEILDNCRGKNMIEMMANSFCVVIPLKDINISSGQLVFLQAMALGKPVIVTENVTAHDYIYSGQNGYIIQKEKDELRECINRLSNKDVYHSISKNAKKTFIENYTLVKLAESVERYI